MRVLARPTKSVNVISKHLTAEELETRKATEQRLKGSADKIKPPKYLSSNQKKIFKKKIFISLMKRVYETLLKLKLNNIST